MNVILNLMPRLAFKKFHLSSGQFYLDLIISVAVLSILGLTLFRLSALSYELISYNRSRIAARHLAQEKTEFIRNLPYDDIGTVGGIPSGTLIQLENTEINGLNYVIRTSIIYIDDPFDGQAPDDLLPTDYKRMRIDVSWGGLAASNINPITIITDISPKGIETSAGGGTLSILVFDANADPVPQADVHIVASSVTPSIDLNLKTADNGRVVLPGTPICVECYEITVTKPNYSLDKTYSQAEVANPNKPQASLLVGQLTEISFRIDMVSTLNLTTRDNKASGYIPLGGVEFRLRNDKTIGTDTSDEPVYKFDEEFTSNPSGTVTISDVEWGNYVILLPTGTPYDVASTNPLTPLIILPNSTVDFNLALTGETSNNLWAVFTDGTSSAPVASVSARLSQSGVYEPDGLTGLEADVDWGQVFWAGLSPGTWTLEATASGYQDFSGDIIVSGKTKEVILLNPQ